MTDDVFTAATDLYAAQFTKLAAELAPQGVAARVERAPKKIRASEPQTGQAWEGTTGVILLAGDAPRADFWIASLNVRTETSFLTMVCWQRSGGDIFKVNGSSHSVITLAETPSLAEKAVLDALDAVKLG
jgi:hypothetical protein